MALDTDVYRTLRGILAMGVGRTRTFFDALREDRFFLVSYLIGSFPSASVLLFEIILLVLATFKRLTDLELRRAGVGE